MKKILVIGSSNTDMVVKARNLPKPGETIIGEDFLMNPGGKGANQAVAASRLGGNVSFICKIGSDSFGEKSYELFKKEHIDVSHILKEDNASSGVALIMVDHNGENSIVVAPGTNGSFSVEDVKAADFIIKEADILMLQLEIPMETVKEAARIAHENNVFVILNPAPAPIDGIPDDLLRNVDLIIPNETETEIITAIKVDDEDSAARAADEMWKKGCKGVIITMGSKGAFLSEKQNLFIPSYKVKAIDTTAAGDVFCGALCVAIAEDVPLDDAVRFACRASAIAVTRMGAQASIPYRNEIDNF